MDNGPGLTQRKFPLAWQFTRQSYLTETYSDFGRAWVGTTQMPDSHSPCRLLSISIPDFKAAETRHRHMRARGLVPARHQGHDPRQPVPDREALDSRVALYAAPAFHSNIRPVPGRSNPDWPGHFQNSAARLAPAGSAFAGWWTAIPLFLPFPRFRTDAAAPINDCSGQAILLPPDRQSRSRPDKTNARRRQRFRRAAEATPLKRSTQHKRAQTLARRYAVSMAPAPIDAMTDHEFLAQP